MNAMDDKIMLAGQIVVLLFIILTALIVVTAIGTIVWLIISLTKDAIEDWLDDRRW